MSKNGVTVLRGKQSLEEIVESVRLLADVEVLVGFPEDQTERKSDAITNAALGYIHDNGAPEVNIPARPFMIPAMNEAEPRLASKMANIANAVIKRGAGAVVIEQGLHQVGLIAKVAIQNKINEGIPPPLADATLRMRARKRPGRVGPGLELLSRSKGYAPGMAFVKPLIDTGELRNSVNYAIRSRKKRSK